MHTFTGVSASPGVVIGPVEQIDHGTTGLHRLRPVSGARTV